MTTEVELKAWVDDFEALRAAIAQRYRLLGSYTKEDRYYRLVSAGEEAEFRLRADGGRFYVTAKRKSIRSGVEVNEEMEFTVSDGEEFDRFAGYLGASLFARKRKSGERFEANGATIELSHVEGLGDFIEIERLVDTGAGGEIRRAEEEIRSLLHELSVPESKIEPRYYIDMLAERRP